MVGKMEKKITARNSVMVKIVGSKILTKNKRQGIVADVCVISYYQLIALSVKHIAGKQFNSHILSRNDIACQLSDRIIIVKYHLKKKLKQ